MFVYYLKSLKFQTVKKASYFYYVIWERLVSNEEEDKFLMNSLSRLFYLRL